MLFCFISSDSGKKKVKNQVLNRTGILNTIFPAAILGKGGKLIAKSRPVKKPDGTIDEGALKDNMERTAAMEMDYFAQILVRNTFEYIRSRFVIEESDVKKIVDVSCAIPEGEKNRIPRVLCLAFQEIFDGAKYPDSTDRKCSKISGSGMWRTCLQHE